MPRTDLRNPQTKALLEMLGLPYNLDHAENSKTLGNDWAKRTGESTSGWLYYDPSPWWWMLAWCCYMRGHHNRVNCVFYCGALQFCAVRMSVDYNVHTAWMTYCCVSEEIQVWLPQS